MLKKEWKKCKQKPASNCLRPLAIAIAIAVTGTVPSLAHAQTFIVSNTNVSGPGSLHRAINDSNSNMGPDNITFTISPGSIINVSNKLSISDSLIITGPTAGDNQSVILDAGGNSELIEFITTAPSQNLILENITFRGSSGVGVFSRDIFGPSGTSTLNHTKIIGNASRGLVVDGSQLVLNHSVVSGNLGGGVKVDSDETNHINHSIISDNIATYRGGAGLLNSSYGADTIITQSTISGNTFTGENSHTSNGGGGIFSYSDLIINQSTISGNSTTKATSHGGGIWGVNITLNQSTVSGNSANFAKGGGIFFRGSSNATGIINQSTITKNYSYNYLSGCGVSINLFHQYVNLELTNSILSNNCFVYINNFHDRSGNASPPGIFNAYFSLFGDPLSEINGNSTSAYEDNFPQLGPLQHNAGLTQTHKPVATITSPVINKGNASLDNPFISDQRGVSPRVKDNEIDMGSVELQNISSGVITPLNPNEILTRRDMAREILKAIEGENYVPIIPSTNNPYTVTGIYDDVNVGDINAVFIEEFERRGFTEGCAPNRFCPDTVVTRAEMARVFIKAAGLTPFGNPIGTPPLHTANYFYDVPSQPLGADNTWEFITAMRDNSYSVGCKEILINTGVFPNFNLTLETFYCPNQPVDRKWFNTLLGQLP